MHYLRISRRLIGPLALVLVVGTVGYGCTLAGLDQTECTDSSQCEAAFGSGSMCGSGGFCVGSGGCETTFDCVAQVGFGATCDPNTNQCRDLVASDIERRCERTEPTDLLTNVSAHRDRIVFLTSHNRTASAGHLGREAAVRAATIEINQATVFQDQSGVSREFGLVMCDSLAHDATDPDDYPGDELGRSAAAIAGAEWGVRVLGVPGIIGPAGSSDTISTFNEVVTPAGGAVVQMANGAASPALTTADEFINPNPNDDAPGWLWRSSSSGEGQGVVLANDLFNRSTLNGEMLRDSAVRTVALIHETGAFGSGIANAFQDEWLRITGRDASSAIVLRVNYEDGNLDEMRAGTDMVTAMLDQVDGVFFGGQVPDHNAFMVHISRAGSAWLSRSNLPIYFPQTAIGPGVFAGAENNDLFNQVIAANPSVPFNSNAYLIFKTAFVSVDPMMRDPDGISQTAASWDAYWLLAAGAMWAGINEGVINGINISRGIRRLVPLNPGNNVPDVQFDTAGWAVMSSAFTSGPDTRVDAVGATGELSYDLATEEKPTEITILKSETTDGTSPFEAIAQCNEALQCTGI